MRGLIVTITLALFTTMAVADDFVPDRRVVVTSNTDFPGSDLQSIFDTSIQACQAACLDNAQCQAFTFNQRSNSCFLKSGVNQSSPYQGAISAQILATNPQVLAQSRARAADLGFLFPGDLTAARQMADTLGFGHPANGRDFADLLAQARSTPDDRFRTPLMGAALSLSDDPALWLEFAERSYSETVNGQSRQVRGPVVVPAIVNAYLRAQNDGIRVTALLDLARALEQNARGGAMIPALRLAQEIQPGRDIEVLLDQAIAKYGFRVVDTTVESDSATPRVCAQFSEPLARVGVDYTPFVQLADPKLVVEVNGSQLCVDGVEHGARYRLSLRAGLPAASGETLYRPVELSLYVRDRSPAVRFVSRAYVLPRLGDVAIPIESVNLASAELTLRRMSDRNVIRSMQEGMFASPLYDYNQYYFDDQFAETIWTGSADLAQDLNRDMLTRLPLGDALAGQPAGVYVLSAAIAGADPYESPAATQWFILSDLGIATMAGTDGLTVMVRSLADATATAGVNVTLLSEVNSVLGTATTDADGIARFAPGLSRGLGSARPGLVTVEKGDDMAFLSLTDPAFDLSDRGVEGREPAGPIDVFLATDRGAYRAGETIHLTALMRDATAAALPGVPLTAILTRPDGVEYSRITSTADNAGGHVFALPVGASAPRGSWRVSVNADVDAPALATKNVLVEDFLPERIDFDLSLPDIIRLGDAPSLTIDARYLFGAPGADLGIEGEATLRLANGLAQFPGYRFGREDEPFDANVTYLSGERTGDDGTAVIPIELPDIDAAGRPLELAIAARLTEGSGRPVERRISATVLPGGPMIGIKPEFDDVVPEGADAKFTLIGLSADLGPEPMEVVWTINRVRTTYQWYAIDGNWNWEPVTTRERIATGGASLGDSPIAVSGPVQWGEYELLVERTGGDYLASSTTFYAGWYAPADASATPDLLEASLDKPAYAIGDTATFRLVPRFAGTAVVTVMSNHIIHMQTAEVAEGENLINLPVTDDWGAGAYVTATIIRPMDAAAGRNPTRALGLAYAPVAPGDKALTVGLDVPDAVQPRGTLDVGIRVEGIKAGETAYVTLAAVDVGILNLTGFQAPDPQGYYFGQRKLGVEMRDVYGRLIDGLNGALGSVRSGGDAMADPGMQSPPPTEELVAFFQGPVTVGPDGKAAVTFTVPSFNGTVKLMAVAWSDSSIGQASQDVLIRDPVVVTASVPRFLAPGDTSRLLLEIVHAEGPVGEMKLNVTASGLALAGQIVPATFTLAEGGKQTLRIPFGALDAGMQSITVTLTTPDGRELAKTLTVPVLANDPQISRMSRFSLAPGETFAFDDQVFTGLVSGSGSSTLAIGSLARFDTPGLLNALDRYPYGCTEQIASAAMPLIYFDQVAQVMGLGARDQVAKRIDEAITEVLENQDSNGAFGLWYPTSGDMWLDAFVTDFLSRAKAAGHNVPDIAFRNAIDNLRNQVNYYPDFDNGGTDLAYAMMVLAREGAAAVGDLRYYADQRAENFATALSIAQLGAALAYTGDQTRADAMFSLAGQRLTGAIGQTEQTLWRSDFGTNRRDAAAVLTLAAEAGSNVIDREALSRRVAPTSAYVSTQEAAWTLLAAHAMIGDAATSGITIDGEAPNGPLVRVIEADAMTSAIRVSNSGNRETELTVTTYGVPSEPEPAGGNGYAIERAYFTMDGQSVDLAGGVTVGTRLVTVITVKPFGRQEARLMVNDPLPAGFEIDNPNIIQGGEIRGLDWLDPVRGESAQFRTDRFLAAVDRRSDALFRLAYIVRAISPGSFHHPAASVEDMYRPQMRARSDAGQVVISE